MSLTKISTFIGALSLSFCVFAADIQDVRLVDGSTMRAEVISLNNGIYTVRSATLGDINIPAVNISSIGATQQGRAAAPAAASINQADISAMRESIINDPNAMARIHSLENDPLVQNILNDETTMRAISSGDLNALMNDPKVKALLDHATVRELTTGRDL